MKMIVISYPGEILDEGIVINRLFEEGLECFHLRKPGWDQEKIEQLLKQLTPEFLKRIVIHDHFNIAESYALGGIHFTKKTKSDLYDWLHFSGTKSISCHNLKEIKELTDIIDYTFLSPVFPSISKRGYAAQFDLLEVRECLKEQEQTEVIALGGITENKLLICKKMGFDGVAVLGRIWKPGLSTDEMINRFKIIRNSWKRIDHL